MIESASEVFRLTEPRPGLDSMGDDGTDREGKKGKVVG